MASMTEVERGAMSGEILAMPITLMMPEGIANGNILQMSRMRWNEGVRSCNLDLEMGSWC